MNPKNYSADNWSIRLLAPPPKRRSRAPAAGDDLLRADFLPPGGEIAMIAEAAPTAAEGRRGVGGGMLDFTVPLKPAESAVLVVRHTGSGAITFHSPVAYQRRGSASPRSRAANDEARFVLAPRSHATARRGLLSQAVKLIVIKVRDAVLDKLAEHAVLLAGRVAEDLWWQQRGLAEGLFRVRVSTTGKLSLHPANIEDAAAGSRSLLLLHGTFSDAVSAFAELPLAPGGFFPALQSVYGERIFAFNHHTVSRSPLENARDLLDSLPEGQQLFDVISHSRGGLVLRCLCELGDTLGAPAHRFRLGRGVLVAAPNEGTPLATPARWDQTLGLVANLLEMFPDNPWSTAAEFVANGLLWLAKHLTGDLPGIAAMDADGAIVAGLQRSGSRFDGSYSALTSNFHPTGTILARLLDAGADAFFAGANDLVVPAEGSWLADAAGSLIPAERIGCFGPGGNLTAANGQPIHHLNYFNDEATVRFLLHSLGIAQEPVTPLAPETSLPSRHFFRRARGGSRSAGEGEASFEPTAVRKVPAAAGSEAGRGAEPDLVNAEDTLHLTILGSPDEEIASEEGGRQRSRRPMPMILAIYGSARVLEKFPTRNSGGLARSGTHFQQIIRRHISISRSLQGIPDKSSGMVPELPDGDELQQFGGHLFEALFVGSVRRLYDVARSQQRGRALNIILTCTVPWIATLPWEFAFDPSRRKFLATEEVHFVRNVLTSVPSQIIERRAGALQILVVAALPQRSTFLDLEEEEARIRLGFKSLVDAGLVQIEVLVDATPSRLHDWIQARDISGHRYDVVHFSGHGEFDAEGEEGKLIFVNSYGGAQEVDVRTLREILCGRGIHLVFLNACDSGRGSRSRSRRNSGVAQALVEGGLPAVVANQYEVLDSAAISFSERFYWSLALGATLGAAAREARIALNYQIHGESIDWAIPVLYARDPEFRLCQPLAQPRRAAVGAMPGIGPEAAAGPRRGAAKTRRLRVGIADIDLQFTELEGILARLNSVQDEIEFKRVDVVVPLGVWQLAGDTDARVTHYLHAERIVEKLKRHPSALGVDLLACITTHPLRDDNIYNLYGWWSGEKERPVLLFSTWNLAIPTLGELSGRVIANELVAGIAAQLLESGGGQRAIHKQGAKSCPFYFNQERDAAQLSQPLRFDAGCREKLLGQLPAALVDAFDSLLGAFANGTD